MQGGERLNREVCHRWPNWREEWPDRLLWEAVKRFGCFTSSIRFCWQRLGAHTTIMDILSRKLSWGDYGGPLGSIHVHSGEGTKLTYYRSWQIMPIHWVHGNWDRALWSIPIWWWAIRGSGIVVNQKFAEDCLITYIVEQYVARNVDGRVQRVIGCRKRRKYCDVNQFISNAGQKKFPR